MTSRSVLHAIINSSIFAAIVVRDSNSLAVSVFKLSLLSMIISILAGLRQMDSASTTCFKYLMFNISKCWFEQRILPQVTDLPQNHIRQLVFRLLLTQGWLFEAYRSCRCCNLRCFAEKLKTDERSIKLD